ncbi:MAG: hypothetical protein WBB19_05275 [Desulforhopalus sp.]
MIAQEELRKFKNMWTWLIGYPAHDRMYYMQHVVKLDEMWINNCPLANEAGVEKCKGCQTLWDSNQGSLCTDPQSPVYRWINTDRNQPDKRSFYARQVAVIAMNALHETDK